VEFGETTLRGDHSVADGADSTGDENMRRRHCPTLTRLSAAGSRRGPAGLVGQAGGTASALGAIGSARADGIPCGRPGAVYRHEGRLLAGGERAVYAGGGRCSTAPAGLRETRTGLGRGIAQRTRGGRGTKKNRGGGSRWASAGGGGRCGRADFFFFAEGGDVTADPLGTPFAFRRRTRCSGPPTEGPGRFEPGEGKCTARPPAPRPSGRPAHARLPCLRGRDRHRGAPPWQERKATAPARARGDRRAERGQGSGRQ